MKANWDILKKVDILAHEIRLNVGGQPAIKTYTGAFLSLAYICLAMTVAITQFLDFADSSNPRVFEEIKITGNYLPVDLSKDKQLPIILLTDPDGNLIPFNTTREFFTIKVTRYTTTLDSNGTFEFGSETVPTRPCGDLIRENKFDPDYFVNLGTYKSLVDEAVCFDTSSINSTIEGSFSTNNNAIFFVQVYPCTTDPSYSCRSKKEMRNMWILFTFLEPNIDLSNKKTPVSHSANVDYFFKINPGTTLNLLRKISKAVIQDESGFLSTPGIAAAYSEENKLISSYGGRDENQIACDPKDFNALFGADCMPYLELSLMSSNHFRRTNRSYKGILETLGEIGGLQELILVSCMIVYHHYHKYISKRIVVEKIFGIKEQNCCTKKIRGTTNKLSAVNGIIVGQNESAIDRITVEDAYKKFESCLDVYRLSQDIEALRILLKVIWNDLQREKIPLTVLKAESLHLEIHDFFQNNFVGPSFKHQNDRLIEEVQEIPSKFKSKKGSALKLKEKIINKETPPTEHASDTFRQFREKYLEFSSIFEFDQRVTPESVKSSKKFQEGILGQPIKIRKVV